MRLKILNLSNLFILLTILAGWYVTSVFIQPFLHYSFQQIGFNTGIDSFRKFTTYPGGIADYLAEFLSQLFMFNSFGSFLIVTIASLQGLIALDIVNRLAGKIKGTYSVFTAILLFGIVVFCDYRYPYYASMRLLFVYIFTWGFCLINSKSPKLSVFLWPVLAGILFYLANGFALIVFALSTAILFIITNKQRIWLIAVPVFLLLAGLLPYIGYKYIFQMTISNIFGITMVKPPEQLVYLAAIPIYTYYLLLPAILLGTWFFILFSEKVKSKKEKGTVFPKSSFFNRPFFLVPIQALVFAVAGYFLFTKSVDPLEKKLTTIEYYAENEKWIEILKLAESIEKYDFRVNFQINRAYSHLGQLPENLFNYPQLYGSYGLFVDPGMQIGNSDMPTSDLFFDLGFMSESQHWAFEAQTLFPNSPRILKRLVVINLVNRKYNLAEKFLKVLDQNMLYHDWVSKYEKYVSDTILASTDQVIAEKRRFTPNKQVLNSGILDGLKRLVATNPDNRMAYDYLLTFCILDSNFKDFIDYLKYYTRFNMKRMPRSWEEALILNSIKNKSFPAFVTAETISKQCMQRITNFNQTVGQFKGDLPSAKSTLFRDFSDSYWYYMLYLSPKATNILKNKTDIR